MADNFRGVRLQLPAVVLIAVSVLVYCRPGYATSDASCGRYPLVPTTTVKNIILMVGDGMGLAQLNAARLTGHGAEGCLSIDEMPVVGLIRTGSANDLLTDSAAASTALATGHKTNNFVIGMLPDGRPVKTILEAAGEKGLATGLVVTSSITHATPAAFATHIDDRYKETQIAEQLIASNVDVLFGGGKGYFLQRSRQGSQRTDESDLITKASKRGYQVVETSEELQTHTGKKVLGLFQIQAMTTRSPEPSLADLTSRAVQLLERSEIGFFLMVEGSQIDWAAHDNDANETIRQTLLFDQAVRVALDYARQDGQTLVVVTADHETGGMAINGGAKDGTHLAIAWTTQSHTALDVPLFAFGPNALDFTGAYDNTCVPRLFARYLGLKDFPQHAGKAARCALCPPIASDGCPSSAHSAGLNTQEN